MLYKNLSGENRDKMNATIYKIIARAKGNKQYSAIAVHILNGSAQIIWNGQTISLANMILAFESGDENFYFSSTTNEPKPPFGNKELWAGIDAKHGKSFIETTEGNVDFTFAFILFDRTSLDKYETGDAKKYLCHGFFSTGEKNGCFFADKDACTALLELYKIFTEKIRIYGKKCDAAKEEKDNEE